eukprot:4408587-Alexandrium_andersonii.AAC.1
MSFSSSASTPACVVQLGCYAPPRALGESFSSPASTAPALASSSSHPCVAASCIAAVGDSS